MVYGKTQNQTRKEDLGKCLNQSMTSFAALHILENGAMKKCKSVALSAQMDAPVWLAEITRLIFCNTNASGVHTLILKRIVRIL
nr:MAG TPA: hypothetical protein [Caudoviricetes sp.]